MASAVGHTTFADAAMRHTSKFSPHCFTLLFAGDLKPLLPTRLLAYLVHALSLHSIAANKKPGSLFPSMRPLDSEPLPFVAAACLPMVKPDWDAVYRQGGG